MTPYVENSLDRSLLTRPARTNRQVPIGVTGRTGSKDTDFAATLFVLVRYMKQSLAREKIAVEHVGPKMNNICSLWALKLSRSKSSHCIVPCGFYRSSSLPNCCWCKRKSTSHSLSNLFVLRGSQKRRTSNRNTSLGKVLFEMFS
jgi:hypothetical protein